MAALPNERLIEYALKLVVRIDVEPAAQADTLRARLQAWRGRAPEREAAAVEAERRWSMLGGMAGQLRERFELPAEDGGDRRRIRRGVLALLVTGGGAALADRVFWPWQPPQQYRTGTAELLTVRLDDAATSLGNYFNRGNGATGTRLDLNARTDVSVALSRASREVRLTSGELRCDVARDTAWPFRVLTREGAVEVLGTVFSVCDRGGAVSVAVEHGQVRFVPRAIEGRPVAPINLAAGDTLTVRAGGATLRHSVNIANMSAWREGWLVFDNTPLEEALPAINVHRAQPIVAADRRVGALRLTGRFRSNDSAALLSALPGILPLRLGARADGSTLLEAR